MLVTIYDITFISLIFELGKSVVCSTMIKHSIQYKTFLTKHLYF